MRRPAAQAMLVRERRSAAADEGDTVRKACFNMYLAWLLAFGGSGALLRRAA